MAKLPASVADWRLAYVAKQLRLSEPLWWFPYPCLITMGLVLLLTGHLVMATNPRMGHPASLIEFPAAARPDSALWFSMTPIGQEIVITTNDRRVFRWPQQLTSAAPTQPFVDYLRRRVAEEIEAAALLKQALSTQTTVVIAADQRLRYLHLRPVIAALAAAGITSYALETKSVMAARDPGHGASPGGHRSE